jgi:hypothetical protein
VGARGFPLNFFLQQIMEAGWFVTGFAMVCPLEMTNTNNSTNDIKWHQMAISSKQIIVQFLRQHRNQHSKILDSKSP